jgi:hypothetical protein
MLARTLVRYEGTEEQREPGKHSENSIVFVLFFLLVQRTTFTLTINHIRTASAW